MIPSHKVVTFSDNRLCLGDRTPWPVDNRGKDTVAQKAGDSALKRLNSALKGI